MNNDGALLESKPMQIDAAPSDCVFWLGKQLKDDDSVLFINSRANKIRSRAPRELPG